MLYMISLGCSGDMLQWHKKCHFVLVVYCIFLLFGVREDTNDSNHKTHLWTPGIITLNRKRLSEMCSVSELRKHAATHHAGWRCYGFAAEIRAATDQPASCFLPPTSNDPAACISTPVDTACGLQLIITNIARLMLPLHRDWKAVMFDFTIRLIIETPHLFTQIPSFAPQMNF